MLALSSNRVPQSAVPRLLRYARKLEALGSAHYRRSAMAACADCYCELERVAHALEDESSALAARFWHGTALHGLGHHEQALVVMEDALRESAHEIDEPSLYLLWTRASRAEIELPRPLAEIEATFHAIEHALHACGLAERRSRLLVNRARLALSRGRLAEAIAYGEEALERQRSESNTYSRGAHYWPLIAAYTWAGEPAPARRHLERWQKSGLDGRTSRVFMACRQAELERREGRLARSLAYAQDAWKLALATDEHQLHIFATHALVQVQLARGQCAAARGVLAFGLANRHCEFGEHAHLLRLLTGDLALAEARWLGGLAPLDPESGREHGRKRRPRNAQRALARLETARQRYQRSEARGRALDALLDCQFRGYGLAARRALLAQTRAEL